MSNLPTRIESSEAPVDFPTWTQRPLPDDGSAVRYFLGVLSRRFWWIAGFSFIITLVAAIVLSRMTPIYSAWVTLRVSGREPNLPEVFRTLSTGSAVSTEMGILGSRALVEDAVDSLGLRLRLLRPAGALRGEVFRNVRVLPGALNRTYRLAAGSSGRFLVVIDSSPAAASVAIGEPVEINGLHFTLAAAASRYDEIAFQIVPEAVAASALASSLMIERPSHDADLVTLGYEDVDSQLVRQVPNLIAERFILRRQETQRTEARSTVKFLTAQIERLSVQLATAEEQLRRFRERQRVIDPETEASKQVARLIDAQSERAILEAERETVDRSLSRVDSAAARGRPGDPSPYRELLAIPSLLKNASTAQLLGSLATADEQRAELLVRRTPEDPDVKALSSRIGEIEGQLHGITTTYLQALTFQLGSMDTTLGKFSRDLGALPRKEVEYGRLSRQTKTLEEAYTMLQTRLKEAQIAEAIQDPSVQVVDTAVTPLRPTKPRRRVGVALALAAGLLVGAAAAFLREHLDGSVHSRRDVTVASGLPVLGLIPRIARRSGRIAMVAQKREIPIEQSPPALLPGKRGPGSHVYTFFGSAGEPTGAVGEPPPQASRSPMRRVRFAVNAAGNPAAEAYATLQTNLAFSSPDSTMKVLVLTSALPGDGKSTCALNLAITLTLRGLRTVLIDADLRRGVLHQAFDLSRSPGLSDVLVGTVMLPEALRSFEVEGSSAELNFLSCGAVSSNPTGLLESDNLRTLLDGLRRTHDRIIIDSPPVNIVTDAAVLSAQADGALLVARSGVTDGAALVYAVDQLEHVSAPVVGVILNDIDFRKEAAYDGAYKYYNYNEYLSRT
jgi:capsular exopolysaccharide synthesis family protein